MPTLLELKRAGYSDEEIALWYNDKRLDLDQAGFNRVEQSNYFGIPFQTQVATIDSLIGSPNPEDIVKPENENFNPKQIKDAENTYTLAVDANSEKRKQKKLQEYEETIFNQTQDAIMNRDEIPYNFRGLEHNAFINRNLATLDKDTRIYDDRGKPLDKTYDTEFTLNENFITGYAGHTLRTLSHLYEIVGVGPDKFKTSSYVLDEVLKHYAKVLSGNESWGARSYSWGDGTYGMFRMTADQVQTGINAYIDILTKGKAHSPDFPYWLKELEKDKDISGITQDAQAALFLAYLSKQEGFNLNFKGALTGDKGSVKKLFVEQFLLPRNQALQKIKREDIIIDFETQIGSYIKALIKWEGFISESKIATKGEEFETIGFGHLDVTGEYKGKKITKEEGLKLLKQDIITRLPLIEAAIPNFHSFPMEVKTAILVGWFRGDIKAKHDTVKLINEGKFIEAATEYLKHKGFETAEEKGRAGIIPRMKSVRDALLAYGKQLEKGEVVSVSDDFQRLKGDEFRNIENRLLSNLETHWLDKKTPADIENTSMQLPAFGKFMPDIISMSGDHLMGEGRKDAWERGGMASATEMMWRLYSDLKIAKETGKKLDAIHLIEDFLTEGQRWDKRGMAGIRSIAQDLVWFGLGSVAGMGEAALLTFLTGGLAAPLSPYIITGNAFALHGVLRHALIETYMQSEADTFEGFWNILLSDTTKKIYGKDFALGAMVYAGGAITGKIAGPILNKWGFTTGRKLINKRTKKLENEYTKWGQFLFNTSKVSGEITMLASVPSVIRTIIDREEYLPPSKADFLDAAVIIFGLRMGLSGVHKTHPVVKRGVKKLYRLYYQTGKTPKETLKDIGRDESVLDEVQDQDVDMPSTYETLNRKVEEQMNKSTGKNNENLITNIPKPKFQIGEEVNADSTGNKKAKITKVGYENGEHFYILDEGTGQMWRMAEHLLVKHRARKDKNNVWVDQTKFKNKQSEGDYDSKIEVLQRDDQVYENNRFDINQATDFGSIMSWFSDKTEQAISNNKMLFIRKYYSLLTKKLKEHATKSDTDTLDFLVKQFIPKTTNEVPIKFLFTVGKDNRLDTEVPVIVGEAEGRMFHFDLQAYMALRKIMTYTENTEVTVHIETTHSKYNVTGKKDTASAVLIFRDSKHNLTGLLHSRVPNHKVTNEAFKFKQEFGTKEKEFADVEYTSIVREQPKWEDIKMHKDTNVFRGFELYDLVKMFKELSEGDTPSAKKFRRLKKFGYAAPFGKMVYQEGGKGTIQLSKDLINAADKDYGLNLENIKMTMAHELGHYIDFIPEATLARGNILGHISSLLNYGKNWIAGKIGGEGPFTDVELAKFRSQAEKTARAERNKNNKIIKDHGFNPKDVLKILTDAKAREYLPAAIYEAFAKASVDLKKAIIADALNGINNPAILKVLSGKEKVSPVSRERINALYNEIIRREVWRRGLVGRSEVMYELKKFTLFAKPIKIWSGPHAGKNVTPEMDIKKVIVDKELREFIEKYRFTPSELMADFMMGYLLRPRELENIAPIAFKLWRTYMEKKPEVKREWEKIQMELSLPEDVKQANILRDQAISFAKTRQNMVEKANKEMDVSDAYDLLGRYVDTTWATILNYYRRIQEMKGWKYAGKENKRWSEKERNNVELAIENLIYGDTLIESVQNKLWQQVFMPMQDAGINRDIFAAYLHNKWVGKVDGPRANVLNPKGVEVILANKLARQQEKATPRIEEIAERFYRYREEVIMPLLEKSEVFDAATLAMFRNNREYITFVVEEYANWRNDNWVKSFVHKTQYGTAKEIMNPFEATILKDWQLITIAQRHFAVGVISRWLFQNKDRVENDLNRKELNWKHGFKLAGKYKILRSLVERTIEPAKRMIVGTGLNRTFKWTPKDKNLDLSKYTLIEYTQFGKNRAVYMGNEVAFGLKNMGGEKNLNTYFQWMYALNSPYRKMFTELNPTFWAYNIFRDINRTILNLPHTTYLDIRHGFKNAFLLQVKNAWTPTFRNMFKRAEIQDKDIVDMLDRRLVISVYSKYRSAAQGMAEGTPTWAAVDGMARGMIFVMRKPNWRKLSDAELEALFVKGFKEKRIKDLTRAERDLSPTLRDGIISKFETQMYTESWFNNDANLLGPYVGPPLYKLVTDAEKLSRVFERTTKLAAFRHLNKLRDEGIIDWTDAQIDYAIRNWAGSPNFLRKGGAAALYNNIFLFGNAAKEEWRSVLEAKRYQGMIWWPKLFAYAVAPQAIYWAGKLGLMGTAAHLYFNLIGNDTLANYYVVPLGIITDAGDGGYGFEWGVPSDLADREFNKLYKVVYLQFPKDEMLKMTGAALYHGYGSLFKEIADNPLDNTYENLLKGAIPALDANLPSLSPIFESFINLTKVTGWSSEPPKDSFTGMPIWPKRLQDAKGIFGGTQRLLAYGKWLWNNSGGLMFYKFDTFYDPFNTENIVLEVEKKLGIPIFGKTVARFLKISNQGVPEKIIRDIEEGRQINNHYMAVADHAVYKIMNGKELNEEEKTSLIKSRGWLKRWQKSIIGSYSTSFYSYLTNLTGDDFTRAVLKMADIHEEIGYEFPFFKIGKTEK